MPHLPTPAEAERLRRFEWLVEHPGAIVPDDRDALAAGWRQWWREGRWSDIRRMAASLTPGLVAGDRRVATYALAAELRRGR